MDVVRFYVATGLERASVAKQVADALVGEGWTWTYDWTAHGSVQAEGEARIREVAESEARGVATADIVVVLLPGGRGTHAELGMAIALGKRIVLHVPPEARADFIGPRICAFYAHPSVEIVEGELPDLFEVLHRDRDGIPIRGPGSARHVYVGDAVSSIEVENPTNASGAIFLHCGVLGGPVKIAPGGSFGLSRDAILSAERFRKMAVIGDEQRRRDG